METLVFLTDAMAVVLLVLFSLRDDRSKPGTPTTGLFRFTEYKVPGKTRAVPSYLQDQAQPTARKDGPA
jgi:hypothetical protein